MKPYDVVFSRRAGAQIRAIVQYLAVEASPIVAERYASRLTDFCYSLAHFPNRGLPQHDIVPGLRTMTYARSMTIAYVVDDDTVVVVGVYTAGQNYLSDLAQDK